MSISPFGSMYYGFWPDNSTTSFALDATSDRIGFGFFVTEPKTLNSISARAALTGSLGENDIVCDIVQASTASTYQPGTTVLGATSTADQAYSGTTTYTWTGLNVDLTPGVMYYAVLRNVNATPATNYLNFSLLYLNAFRTTGRYGHVLRTSANSGSTWATQNVCFGRRLNFSDGTYSGAVYVATALASTSNTFGSNEGGFLFKIPQNMILNAAGLAFHMGSAGAPAGACQYKLYEGTTHVATTVGSMTVQAGAGGLFQYFSSPVKMKPSTWYRATASSPSSINNTNCWRVRHIEIDPGSYLERPFDGTLQMTSFNGTTWTQTPNYTGTFCILLDFDSEMYIPGTAS